MGKFKIGDTVILHKPDNSGYKPNAFGRDLDEYTRTPGTITEIKTGIFSGMTIYGIDGKVGAYEPWVGKYDDESLDSENIDILF